MRQTDLLPTKSRTASSWSGSNGLSIAGTHRSPTTSYVSQSLSPSKWPDAPSLVVSTAHRKPCGSLAGSSVTSATTPNCLGEMRSTSGPWSDSEGWSRSATAPCMGLPCSTSTDSPQPTNGKNCQRHCLQRLAVPRWPDELQLHPDQPLSDLPPALSPSLPRRLAGEGHPGRHALRASL